MFLHHSLFGIRYLWSSLHLREIRNSHENVSEVVDVMVVFLSWLFWGVLFREVRARGLPSVLWEVFDELFAGGEHVEARGTVGIPLWRVHTPEWIYMSQARSKVLGNPGDACCRISISDFGVDVALLVKVEDRLSSCLGALAGFWSDESGVNLLFWSTNVVRLLGI